MGLVGFISISPKIRRQQVAHAHEVVTGEGEQSGVFDLVATAELRSSQQTNILAPTKGLLNEPSGSACSRGDAWCERRLPNLLSGRRFAPRAASR